MSTSIGELKPNKYGNYQGPYCSYILTPILREWMNPPQITDYLCHHCQIGFKVNIKRHLGVFL